MSRVKLRDRAAEVSGADRIAFTSAILPRWARRTKSLDALLPVLYLRGISTGDFQEALAALLGKDAPNLSPSVIGRLKEEWQADHDCWQRRDLSARRLTLKFVALSRHATRQPARHVAKPRGEFARTSAQLMLAGPLYQEMLLGSRSRMALISAGASVTLPQGLAWRIQ